MARVFTPVSAEDIAALQDDGSFRPTVGFSATASLRRAWPDEDDEGLEYVATQYAATASQAPRIVVAALEVAPELVNEAHDAAVPGLVEFSSGVLARDVVCFLVADAGAKVSDDADLELSWYDSSELGSVADQIASH